MNRPLVSVLLPTCDTPDWLSIALRCYGEQDYPNRELLVLDDGVDHPADASAVAEVGGRIIRFDASLSLGTRLNVGAAAASGTLLHVWTTDDIFGPGFISAHVDRFRADPQKFDAPIVVAANHFLVTTLSDRRMWQREGGTLDGSTCIPRRLWADIPYPEAPSVGTTREHVRLLAAAGVRRRGIDATEHLLVVRRNGMPGLPPPIDPGFHGPVDADTFPKHHRHVWQRRWSTDLPDWVRQHFERQRRISARHLSVTVIVRVTTPTARALDAVRDISQQKWPAVETLLYPDTPETMLPPEVVAVAGVRVVYPRATDRAARLDEVVARAAGAVVMLWPNDAAWVGPAGIEDHVLPLVGQRRPDGQHPLVGYHQHRTLLHARGQFFHETTVPFASLCATREFVASHPLSRFAFATPEIWTRDLEHLTRPIDLAASFVAHPPSAIAAADPAGRAALADWLARSPADTSDSVTAIVPEHVRSRWSVSTAPVGNPAWQPLVTVVVPTRDRPDLLATTLRAVAAQTWQPLELIVLDDGVTNPVDDQLAASFGGRVLRVPPGITLGEKLNLGAEAARGDILLKMDDDDYFAPDFVAAHVREWREHPLGLDAPIVAGCDRYPILLIAEWRLILRSHPRITGNFAISRRLWERLPYPVVHGHGTDSAYFDLAVDAGCYLARIDGRDHLVMTRRDGIPGANQHTFHTYRDRAVADHFADRSEPDPRPIETLVPDWALSPLIAIRAASPPPPMAPPEASPENGLFLERAQGAHDAVVGPGGLAP